MPVRPETISRYLAEKGAKLPGRFPQAMKLFGNAKKRTKGDAEAALWRFHLTSELRGLNKEQRRKVLTAFNKSETKHGFKSAYERKFIAAVLKSGRRMDAAKRWGGSFEAGLKETNALFSPVDLTNIISGHISRHGLVKASVLEIGPGIGNTANDLRKYYGDYIDMTAVGLKRIPDWQKQSEAKHITWKVAGSQNLKRVAKPGTLDIVYSNLGFAYSPKMVRALEQVYKLLKKDGLFVFNSERDLLAEISTNGFAIVQYQPKMVLAEGGERRIITYVLRKA